MALMSLNRRISFLLRATALVAFVVVSFRLLSLTERPWSEISAWSGDDDAEDGMLALLAREPPAKA